MYKIIHNTLILTRSGTHIDLFK
nr:hypothetical protein [Rickettsiales endosymbiont of Stachyamoeba lipophora]